MFKEQMNRIKSLIVKDTDENKEGNNNKKKIENLVAFLVILIITLIAINMILKDDHTKEKNIDSQYKELAKDETINNDTTSNTELEEKIERILSTMSGVR